MSDMDSSGSEAPIPKKQRKSKLSKHKSRDGVTKSDGQSASTMDELAIGQDRFVILLYHHATDIKDNNSRRTHYLLCNDAAGNFVQVESHDPKITAKFANYQLSMTDSGQTFMIKNAKASKTSFKLFPGVHTLSLVPSPATTFQRVTQEAYLINPADYLTTLLQHLNLAKPKSTRTMSWNQLEGVLPKKNGSFVGTIADVDEEFPQGKNDLPLHVLNVDISIESEILRLCIWGYQATILYRFLADQKDHKIVIANATRKDPYKEHNVIFSFNKDTKMAFSSSKMKRNNAYEDHDTPKGLSELENLRGSQKVHICLQITSASNCYKAGKLKEYIAVGKDGADDKASLVFDDDPELLRGTSIVIKRVQISVKEQAMTLRVFDFEIATSSKFKMTSPKQEHFSDESDNEKENEPFDWQHKASKAKQLKPDESTSAKLRKRAQRNSSEVSPETAIAKRKVKEQSSSEASTPSDNEDSVPKNRRVTKRAVVSTPLSAQPPKLVKRNKRLTQSAPQNTKLSKFSSTSSKVSASAQQLMSDSDESSRSDSLQQAPKKRTHASTDQKRVKKRTQTTTKEATPPSVSSDSMETDVSLSTDDLSLELEDSECENLSDSEVDSELESEAEVNIPQVTPLSSRSKRAQFASKAKAQHGLKLPEPSHKKSIERQQPSGHGKAAAAARIHTSRVSNKDVNAQRQKKQAKTKVIDTSSEPRESTKNLDTNSQRKKRVSFEEDNCIDVGEQTKKPGILIKRKAIVEQDLGDNELAVVTKKPKKSTELSLVSAKAKKEKSVGSKKPKKEKATAKVECTLDEKEAQAVPIGFNAKGEDVVIKKCKNVWNNIAEGKEGYDSDCDSN